MKKILVIIVYFGKLPSLYKAWLKSISNNKSIDFLLLYDDNVTINSTNNLRVVKSTLKDFKTVIQNEFGKEVSLQHAYKICDFRPFFGKIFREEIKGYDFYGYSDIDIIYGDLRKFFNDEILNSYDKIFKWGHFTLIKNSEFNLTLYSKLGSLYNFEQVFTSNENYAFDETTGFLSILLTNNGSLYDKESDYVDFNKFSSQLLLKKHILNHNHHKQLFLWLDGKLFHGFFERGELKMQEKCYFHFQWKKIYFDDSSNNNFYFTSFKIIPLIYQDSKSLSGFIKPFNPIADIYDHIHFLFIRVIKFLKSSRMQKSIVIKKKFFILFNKKF
jgi:hypothetical protein